jgi:hypothetical protein
MIYRLVNLPLFKERYNKEWQYIVNTASLNGYTEKSMSILLKRHQQKLLTTNSTSFVTDNKKRIAVSYHPAITSKLEKECNKQGIQIVSTNNSTKLQTNLNSTKDKTNTFKKSGVYQMICPYEGCTAM